MTITYATGGAVDEELFSTLFFAHAARLVRLAALLGDPDPEDVAQEAFCRLYAVRSRLDGRGEGSVVGYLNRIVVNEVRDRHRRRGIARRDAHLVWVPDVARGGADVGERQAVIDALGLLPQRQREALVLRFWLDLPVAEIAEAMGVRTGTVKSQLSRGLATVENVLGRPEQEVTR
jgi:RNA polymerase sigma factor (sigma-70 family)